jgi:hypothetical protein
MDSSKLDDDTSKIEENKLNTVKPLKKNWFSQLLEDNLEKLLRFLFFWEEDPKKIGGCIRFLHHSVVYMFVIWYIVIHTFLPSFILFILFYFAFGLVWIQHVVCGDCIINRIEQKLIGDTKSFVDPILETFHIPITPESTAGIVVLGSTSVMFMLSCELLIRGITLIKNWFYI